MDYVFEPVHPISRSGNSVAGERPPGSRAHSTLTDTSKAKINQVKTQFPPSVTVSLFNFHHKLPKGVKCMGWAHFWPTLGELWVGGFLLRSTHFPPFPVPWSFCYAGKHFSVRRNGKQHLIIMSSCWFGADLVVIFALPLLVLCTRKNVSLFVLSVTSLQVSRTFGRESRRKTALGVELESHSVSFPRFGRNKTVV